LFLFIDFKQVGKMGFLFWILTQSVFAADILQLCDGSGPKVLADQEVSVTCAEEQIFRKVKNNSSSYEKNEEFIFNQQYSNKDAEIIGYSAEDSNGIHQKYFLADIYNDFMTSINEIIAAQPKSVSGLKVAILDSGIDLSHPDITYKIGLNSREIINGKDDDGNGAVDDLYGFSFQHFLHPEEGRFLPLEKIVLSKAPKETFSHGTHVASIILNNKNVHSLRTYTFPDNWGNLDDVEKYFKSVSADIKLNKIKIVNMSIGTSMMLDGPPPIKAQNKMFYDRLKNIMTAVIVENPETVFVVAAGNGVVGFGADLDHMEFPSLPAAILAPNKITIGSSTYYDTFFGNGEFKATISKFSNYGKKTVDILAPGENILAAQMGGGTVSLSGTSMATPMVVNNCVIPMLEIMPNLTPESIKEIIVKTAYVDPIQAVEVSSSGYINSKWAIAVVDELKKNQGNSTTIDDIISRLVIK
jgi:subtilisin family serine protease